MGRHPKARCSFARRAWISHAPVSATAGQLDSHCARSALAGHSRRTNGWVDDALHARADGYGLLDSALAGVPGAQRLVRQQIRRTAFVGVHAARILLQQATKGTSAIQSHAKFSCCSSTARPTDGRHLSA